MKHELRIEQASNDDWKASAWWLAKMFPDIFGKEKVRVEMSGPDGLPLQVQSEAKTEVVIPDAELPVIFELTEGVLLGTGNGRPDDTVRDDSPCRTTFAGCAQAIIRRPPGAPVCEGIRPIASILSAHSVL